MTSPKAKPKKAGTDKITFSMPPDVAKQIVEDCRGQLNQRPELAGRWLDIDYLSGRVMKVNLSGDEMRTDLYNRDNGAGSAEAIVNSLPDIEAES